MSTAIARFRERHSPGVLRHLGERWTHTNGNGVSSVYQAVYADRYQTLGPDGALVEVTVPSIIVETAKLADHTIGDRWVSPEGVYLEAISSEPQNRTGLTRITLRYPED